nr:MAG TPA: hypothetical protein [Caudoviricetes sp.]
MNIQRHHSTVRIFDGKDIQEERKFPNERKASQAFGRLMSEVFTENPTIVASSKPGAKIINHGRLWGLLVNSTVHQSLHIDNKSLVFAGFLQYIMDNNQ